MPATSEIEIEMRSEDPPGAVFAPASSSSSPPARDPPTKPPEPVEGSDAHHRPPLPGTADSDDEFEAEFGDTTFPAHMGDPGVLECCAEQLQQQQQLKTVNEKGPQAAQPSTSSSQPSFFSSFSSLLVQGEADRTRPASGLEEASFVDDLPPGTFCNARGLTLPPPSAVALRAARTKMDAWQRDDDQRASSCGSTPVSQAPQPASVQGTRQALAPPSSSSINSASMPNESASKVPQRSESAPFFPT